MPKKTKKNLASDTRPTPISPSVGATTRPAKKAAAASKTRSRKVAAGKKPAARGAKKAPPAANKLVEPSDADIRLRAYFIAEHRLQLALPGDSANDWLEAKRQLIEEQNRS